MGGKETGRKPYLREYILPVCDESKLRMSGSCFATFYSGRCFAPPCDFYEKSFQTFFA